MASIEDQYWGGMLSQAAYGGFSNVDVNKDGVYDETLLTLEALVKSGVGEPGFTEKQAELLLSRFELIRPFEDPGTGFRAALFFDKTTSEYTLAIAGTDADEIIGDVTFADLVGIAATGYASGQIAAMFAFYDELLATGILHTDLRINVVGHSLGGHLATVFSI